MTDRNRNISPDAYQDTANMHALKKDNSNTNLVIGGIVALLVIAGLAWYLTSKPAISPTTSSPAVTTEQPALTAPAVPAEPAAPAAPAVPAQPAAPPTGTGSTTTQ